MSRQNLVEAAGYEFRAEELSVMINTAQLKEAIAANDDWKKCFDSEPETPTPKNTTPEKPITQVPTSISLAIEEAIASNDDWKRLFIEPPVTTPALEFADPTRAKNKATNERIPLLGHSQRNFAKAFAGVALAFLIPTIGATAYDTISAESKEEPVTEFESSANQTAAVELESDTTPTTVLETTTTIDQALGTEEPSEPVYEYIEFEAGHGELVGSFNIPKLCEDNIQVFGYSEQEKIDEVIGSGDALLDRTIPSVDPVSNEDCEAPTERNRSLEPIAGHEQDIDGPILSVFPGQLGNSVIAGHGSTYSEAFADIGLLAPGDEVIFNRADGRTFTYHVIEQEILPDDGYEPFLYYSHDNYESTITIYRCGDTDGNRGSAEARYAVRLGLVESL